MNSALKNRKHLKVIFAVWSVLLAVVTACLFFQGSGWTTYDFQVIDYFYRYAVQHGRGPGKSDGIVLVPITDRSYRYFGRNYLDRGDLARVNDALAELDVQAVAYDIIFPLPSSKSSDDAFASSIGRLGHVYLPVGLQYGDTAQPFRIQAGEKESEPFFNRFGKPREQGRGAPFCAAKAVLQYRPFAKAAFNTGHISDYGDPDGTHRHAILLIKAGDRYVPALSLAMFLDFIKVPFDKVTVDWGRGIVVPALPGSVLEKDVIIPIDNRGRAFIPFPDVWEKGFPMMEAERLLDLIGDESVRGNLMEFFEGKFVLIGDISTGIGDLGNTPLEGNVPLMMTHASLLNAMLAHSFYTPWPFWKVVAAVWLIGVLMGLSAFFKSWWMPYAAGAAVLAAVPALTWMQLTRFTLVPVFTLEAAFLFVFIGLICGLEVSTGRDRTRIRNIFSKYVPKEIVDRLLEKPELLNLGGEERVVTVLFADIVNFTALAEKMEPARLVTLLNEYLGEMTKIVFSHGGIIDKYIGDSIMAEYGVPLPVADHADRAVRTALAMRNRLGELRAAWVEQGYPEIDCCIGINTGPVIVGNMGSHEILDYTVIGDSVNLASRLEGINRHYGTHILVSGFTLESVTPDAFKTRLVDVIKVKGKSEAVSIHEIYGDGSTILSHEDIAYVDAYREGFERYRNRRFGEAEEKFRVALSARPGDLAAGAMIARIDGMNHGELPEDWDGSFLFSVK
jgi:adenylate cyclase